MKKNLVIYLVMAALTFSLAANGYGQIGDWIKLAKDAMDKKKNKKKEEAEKAEKAKAGEQPKTESSQPVAESNNSQETEEAKFRRELLQVKPSDVGKIYFSNKPFTTNHDGAKASFTTGEYIYGRLETDGRTLREILKYPPLTKEQPEHKLIFNLYIYDPSRLGLSGEVLRAIGNYPFAVLTEADLDKTYWNFDVLPEPSKATTRIYDRDDNMPDFIRSEDQGAGVFAFYNYLKERAEEKNYVFRVQFQKKTTDFRGNLEYEDKWLTVEGRGTIDFKVADYAKIKADHEKMIADSHQRWENIKNGVENAQIENEELPAGWTLKSNPLLPGLTESLIRELFQKHGSYYLEKQIIKIYAEPFTSTQRTVVSNELGIPKYRYLSQWFTVFAKVYYEGENKCFYQRFYPVQVYAGAGTYGNYSVRMEERVDVSCAKLGVK